MSTRRQIQLAQLHGTCERYGGGRLDRAEALEDVRAISSDPDVLAEAIAYFRLPRHEAYRRRDLLAEQLRVDVGADVDAVQQYVDRPRPRGLDLGGMGQAAAKLAPPRQPAPTAEEE